MYSSLQMSTEEMQNENFFDIKKETNTNPKIFSPLGGYVFSDFMVNSNSAASKAKDFDT